jgi:hypothetical protein
LVDSDVAIVTETDYEIEKYCSLSSGLELGTGKHPLTPESKVSNESKPKRFAG